MSHPYISGPGNVTQMIGFLRKNFPQTVNSDTVKKFQLASNNESYVINALQFLGFIDEDGKRTDAGHQVMTIHDESQFQTAFTEVLKSAYQDLFETRGEDAWTMTKDALVGYFRATDKTSDIIGGRQAGLFIALRGLAGHGQAAAGEELVKPRVRRAAKRAEKPTTRESKPVHDKPDTGSPATPSRADVALTVRIEINLPAEGTQETYDAIFRSIKANLMPS